MPKYKVTLTTVASITVEVDAADEDEALDAAYDAGREFANQYHSGRNWVVDINDAWDLRDAEIKPR
jgi:hypothetical protein